MAGAKTESAVASTSSFATSGSAAALAVTPVSAKGPFGWQVTGRIGGTETLANVEVLMWADLVKTSMKRGIFETYLLMLRTAWAYIGSGALFGLMRLRKGPMIAALYPILFLVLQLGFALLAGWGWGLVVAQIHWVPGVLAGAAMIWALLVAFRRWDNKVFAYYLMYDYAYSAQADGANPPELEARMAVFRARIGQAMVEDNDEVLVIGHSSGAHLAVSILSDLIREQIAPGGPALGFLTLGQVVPMVSFLPMATRLRADLAYLCTRTELTWVDVTAPGDGCAFALCDPVSVSGMAPKSGKRWPLVLSAAFTQSLSPERWRTLRWKFFRLHFQYICAFDRPKDYDYFQITAGPLTLAERFAGRSASTSRIETPVNRYTSVT